MNMLGHYTQPRRIPQASRWRKGAEVTAQTKARLEKARQQLNPFALRRTVDRQLKIVEAHRRAPGA
jgi:hypothetical protein